jgi:hypothetical protein
MGHPIARDAYALAHERVEDGRWSVDPDAGHVFGERGGEIGYRLPAGYVRLGLAAGGRTREVMRSRLIWESIHGRIGDDLEVVHREDRGDDTIGNLYLNRRRRPA